jgi:hypothetical protein
MKLPIRVALPMTIVAALLLPGCASATASNAASSQCQSKWVAAGNNGAKADRYYQPNCQ